VASPDRNAPSRWPDILLGLATLPVVAFLFVETLSFRKMVWEPLGMAFWPQVVLGGLAVCAVLFIASGILRPREADRIAPAAFVTPAAALLFLLAMPFAGFYAGGGLLVFALTIILAPHRTARTPLVALLNAGVVLLLVWLLFGQVLNLSLPGGLLER